MHGEVQSPLRFALLYAILALTLITSPFSAKADDTVMQWNEIMQRTVAVSNPNFQARSAAIVQLAVYEAVNSILGEYAPYLGSIAAPADASPHAACIAAAHRTLVTLYPTSTSNLDLAMGESLATIADGPAKDAGIAVGEVAAIPATMQGAVGLAGQ